MREIKHGIRRFEKLMRSISDFQTALKLMISEVANIQGAILVLGASPIRPQHVYELSFSSGKSASIVGAPDFAKTRAADTLSKKVPHWCYSFFFLSFSLNLYLFSFLCFLLQAIRALISKGAGSGSYPGTWLSMLVNFHEEKKSCFPFISKQAIYK